MRQVIHWFVTKKLFDNFIMFVILVSSISLASEDPVDEDSPRNVYLGVADYFFTAIFTFEVCLKVTFHLFCYCKSFEPFIHLKTTLSYTKYTIIYII